MQFTQSQPLATSVTAVTGCCSAGEGERGLLPLLMEGLDQRDPCGAAAERPTHPVLPTDTTHQVRGNARSPQLLCSPPLLLPPVPAFNATLQVMAGHAEMLQMPQKPSPLLFYQLAHSWQAGGGSSWREIPSSTLHKSPDEGWKHLLAPGKMFALGR